MTFVSFCKFDFPKAFTFNSVLSIKTQDRIDSFSFFVVQFNQLFCLFFVRCVFIVGLYSTQIPVSMNLKTLFFIRICFLCNANRLGFSSTMNEKYQPTIDHAYSITILTLMYASYLSLCLYFVLCLE